jgi:hypothetical protein
MKSKDPNRQEEQKDSHSPTSFRISISPKTYTGEINVNQGTTQELMIPNSEHHNTDIHLLDES